MRIWVSDAIAADAREVSRVIEQAFREIDHAGVTLRVERAKNSYESFSGRAYPEPPRRPKPPPGTQYFVRLKIPSVLRNRGYPRSYRYTGLRTAPWITVRDWRERLFALAAHEAFHIHQFREGLRRSEVAAERWALRSLMEWIEEQARPAPVPIELEPRAGQLTLFAAAF